MIDFKNEHVSYEISMLQHCFRRLAAPRYTGDQADWNAFHESFCVHARNLLNFLPIRVVSTDLSDQEYIQAIENQVVTLDLDRRTVSVSTKDRLFSAKDKIAFPHDHIRILNLVQDRLPDTIQKLTVTTA
jgi:hypothetical protein